MERFNALGRGAQMMLVAGVLLFIDMFFAWQKVDLPAPFNDYTRKGWYGAAGIILGLLVIVLLAWLIVRLASVDIPLPVSTAMSAAVIATLILIFAIIKLLSILGDKQTIWAWIGVVLAIVIAVGAFQAVQEAGGVDNLRTEATSLTSSVGAGGAAATTESAPAPEPPAASEPAAAAAPPEPPSSSPEWPAEGQSAAADAGEAATSEASDVTAAADEGAEETGDTPDAPHSA